MKPKREREGKFALDAVWIGGVGERGEADRGAARRAKGSLRGSTQVPIPYRWRAQTLVQGSWMVYVLVPLLYMCVCARACRPSPCRFTVLHRTFCRDLSYIPCWYATV